MLLYTAERMLAAPISTPAQITADQNDYAFSGLAPYAGGNDELTFQRLSSDASRTITGIAAKGHAFVYYLSNVGSYPILLANESASSTAANRIITGTGSSASVQPGSMVTLVYDATSARWRCQLQAAAGVDVRDFGAVGDGVIDDTAAIQAAIEAAKYGAEFRWGILEFEHKKTYKVTSSLLFSRMVFGLMKGNGAKLVWAGNTTDPMIRLTDVRDSVFSDFTIVASSSAPLAVGVLSENGALSGVVPTKNTFRNVLMDGTNTGIDKGFQFALGAGGNNNNEQNSFYDCIVANYVSAAWSFEHSQSKGHVLFHCGFSGGASSQRGVATTLGSGTQGGSFTAINCFGGGNLTADFDLGGANDFINVIGGGFENSARLMQSSGPSGAAWSVTLKGIRWAITPSLHADNRAINFQKIGPLVMENCVFEPAQAEAVEIRFNPGGGLGDFVAIGNYIASTLTNPFTGVQPSFQRGNIINRNGGAGDVSLGRLFTTFTDLDATPSVTNGELFATANTGATTITTFDNGTTGQEITIVFGDANTTVAESGNIKLSAAFTSSADDTMKLVFNGTSWFEISRSVN